MPNPWQEPLITAQLVGLPIRAGHGFLQILLKTVFMRQVPAQCPSCPGQDFRLVWANKLSPRGPEGGSREG